MHLLLKQKPRDPPDVIPGCGGTVPGTDSPVWTAPPGTDHRKSLRVGGVRRRQEQRR